jgi:hypothetical protein
MVDDRREPVSVPRIHPARSAPASGRSPAAALIRNLEWLREHVLKRLSSLEALAEEHAASSSREGEIAALEGTLKKRLAELDEREQELCAQTKRAEDEWAALLSRLDEDRTLLADAWERVEQERIEHHGMSARHPPLHGQGPGRQRVAPLAPMHAAERPAGLTATVDVDSQNPAARAILRQFQTLCSDVRRHAEEQYGTS